MNKPQAFQKKVYVEPDMTHAKHPDIVITKYETKIEYNEKGDEIRKRIPVKVNITKKVNEQAKLIKVNTAEQTLAELEEIFKARK